MTIADACHHHAGLSCLSGCADHGVDEEPRPRVPRDSFGREGLYIDLLAHLAVGGVT